MGGLLHFQPKLEYTPPFGGLHLKLRHYLFLASDLRPVRSRIYSRLVR